MNAPLAGGRRFLPAQGPSHTRVLVVDNHDSFTFNLVQYLLELSAVVDVYPNDALRPQDVLEDAPTHVLLSPGPGRPSDAGICPEVCSALCEGSVVIPMLGVCLGHQALCEVHGARVVRADRIMHGKTSWVHHTGCLLFEGIPSPFIATRYHSLLVPEDTLPAGLIATARTNAGELMAVRHRERPVFGVQFHPESILSQSGHDLLRNFLATRGEPV